MTCLESDIQGMIQHDFIILFNSGCYNSKSVVLIVICFVPAFTHFNFLSGNYYSSSSLRISMYSVSVIFNFVQTGTEPDPDSCPGLFDL